MGLAGARKRQKISHDPNNTSWARDASGFGQRILSKQGWTPGSYLGARDAAQSGHFTAASSSHIRITLKDDTLGIGAKRAGETAENFGLGALVDIYGRLNGKQDSKQFQKEQQARADLGAKLYAEQRYGTARFVRGGFLVGDKIEKELERTNADLPSENTDHAAATSRQEKGKEPHSPENLDTSTVSEKTLTKAERKEERLKRKEERRLRRANGESESKEERRKRREERRARKLAKRASKTDETSTTARLEEKDLTLEEVGVDKASKLPTNTPAMVFGGSRQAVRQRYIRAKKMAGMNPQALREILMARS